MPRRLQLVLLPLVVTAMVGGAARADEQRSAADVTELGRTLDRALDVALGGATGERTIVFLIDKTRSLGKAGFDKHFEHALERNAKSLGQTSIGVMRVDGSESVKLAPTRKSAELTDALRALRYTSDDAVRNVYVDIRVIAGALARTRGAREIVLVTFENGDVEDDLEATVKALRKNGVRFSAITREALLSYSLKMDLNAPPLPEDTTPGNGDGPFVSLPWGWLFQGGTANASTPSGFGQYGLSRLAAETQGRILLRADPEVGHWCGGPRGRCQFCENDHLPTNESFEAHRMRHIAPPVDARTQVGKRRVKDPHFRAMLSAWTEASKAGLLYGYPSVRISGSNLKPEKRTRGNLAPLLSISAPSSRLAGKGEKALKDCERIIARLTSDLEEAGPESSGRSRAMADFTLAMLHVTRTNLIGFIAFCRDAAPALSGKKGRKITPPEFELERRNDKGIRCEQLCLCHGVAPFRSVRMPGGRTWDTALNELEKVYDTYMRRYAHTPFGLALRHQGLSRFYVPVVAAVRPVAAEGDQEAVYRSTVARALGEDEDLRARGEAQSALNADASRKWVPYMLEALPSASAGAQERGVYLLQSLPKSAALAALRTLLKGPHSHLRFRAALSLRSLGESGMTAVMVECLEDEGVDFQTRAAMHSRVTYPHDAAIAKVRNAMLQEGQSVATLETGIYFAFLQRNYYYRGQGGAAPTLHAHLVRLRGHEDAGVRLLAACCLRALTYPDHAELIAKTIANENVGVAVLSAARTILESTKPLEPFVLDVVNEKLRKETKAEALRAYVGIVVDHHLAAAVPLIRRLLTHEDDHVSKAAFEALARFPGGLEPETMGKILQGANDARVLSAADVLRRMDDVTGLDRIIKIMRNGKRTEDRAEAARLLRRFRETVAIEALLDALLDEHVDVRAGAKSSLEPLLGTLFPYRTLDLARTGYAPTGSAASRTKAAAKIRAWWVAHRDVDW